MTEAEAFLADDEDTRRRFERVGKLVEGFETPFGLELLATVHGVATREQAATSEDVRAKVYAWNDRKTRFTPRQIEIALGASFKGMGSGGGVGHLGRVMGRVAAAGLRT